MSFRRLSLGAVFLSACSFSVPGVSISGPSVDGEVLMDFGVNDYAMSEADLAGLCSPSGPQSGCSGDGTSLVHCVGGQPQPQECPNGCFESGGAHCGSLDPGGPAAASDYLASGLMDIMIANTVLVDSATGAISGSLERASGEGVKSGIGFRLAAQADGSSIGIFSFRTLNVASGAEIALGGKNVTALVAAGDIQINGVIDAQGTCIANDTPYAGGGAGGHANTGSGSTGGGAGGGGGGIKGSISTGGGGGGGYGDTGGGGTTIGSGTGGAGGGFFGDLTAVDPVLFGGSGGGAGGGNGFTAGGAGGNGGGGIQIASNTSIVIGSDGVINAGGCTGFPSSATPGGGGGGGAGGSILLEAGTFTLTNGAAIAANGGGGAGGGSGSAGANGLEDNQQALGGAGGGAPFGTSGGNGGYGSSTAGGAADDPDNFDSGGGGGGGAVGRIAFKSKSGMVTTNGAIISPSLSKGSGSKPPASTTGKALYD